jgi:hypothetical protein
MLDRIIKGLSKAAGMWWAVLGSCAAFIVAAALTSRLGAITARRLLDTPMTSIEHWLLLALVVTAATCLTAAPCIRFLATGWQRRLDEFRNRIRDGAVHSYLAQFWEKRLDENPEARGNSQKAEALFLALYVAYYGRRAFGMPVLVLLAVTLLSTMLVVQAGIDTCIAHRCLPNSSAGSASTGLFAPVGDVTLPLASAAAVAGAFLFVVSDAILRARRCTMNVSDLYWYALRLVIAIPMGLAFTQLAASTVAGLVAFGLGAFPIDALTRLLRRFTNKSIGANEEAQEPDELIKLDGVTVPIAAAMAAEGIESVDELVGADPVILSLKSGIAFPSILRFASQAVVRIHLGNRAGELTRVGLGNAYLISKLIEDLNAERGQAAGAGAAPAHPSAGQRLADAVAVLKTDASAVVPSPASVEAAFREIANHGYSRFLLSVT